MSSRLLILMHVQSFTPLCAFGSTEDECLEVRAGPIGDYSVFRIWAVTPDHSLFIRILTEPDGYASYLVASAEEIFAEPLVFLPLASRSRQRRARRLLRLWGVIQSSTNHGANSRAALEHAYSRRI